MKKVSLVIGGKAGEGVRAAGDVLGRVFNKAGYFVFIRDDYPSLIKGGHNFSQIHVCSKKILSQKKEIDILAAFDERTIEEHRDNLKNNSYIIVNSDKLELEENNLISLPISSWRKDIDGPKIIENTAFVASIASMCGLDFKWIKKVLKEEYGDQADININIAEKAYEICEKESSKVYSFKDRDRKNIPLLTGNKSILLGAVSAGLDFYTAYPMTPSTSILHFATQYKDKFGIAVMQPENEIGVLNIALGASYGGAKTMVATSGGGYGLMQETLSLAGMSETPIVIVDAQRAGPSTGVPTYTSQADLKFSINAGHGEFPHIVIAPGDAEEAFYASATAMNLAWKYQVPVTLLSDKHLSESSMNAKINPNEIKEKAPKKSSEDDEYLRYKIMKDGVSPLKYPGNDSIVKNTSYEHIEKGYTTEDPEKIEKMQEKRLNKMKEIEKEIKNKETVKEFGETRDNVIITWGSTKGSVIEAQKITERDFSIIQPLFMKPFPQEEIKKKLKDAENIISVENNATAQLTELVEDKTKIDVDEVILKYNMRPFYPKELANQIKEVIK